MVEGTAAHPYNHGKLCPKGSASRQYIYRADRLKTPLLRTGARGEKRFQPISWERAYDLIAEKLGALRDAGEADAAAFYSGYGKWYRPWLERFCHSFGSQSFGTESSACATSKNLAWQVTAGTLAAPDLPNAKLFLGWALNPYYSHHTTAPKLVSLREKGLKIIVVDPRVTPASEKLADLHLRPRPGTDGALAFGLAHELCRNGWIDREYISRHVVGFDEYRAYIEGFDPDTVETLTGVPRGQLELAARMIHEAGVFAMKENSAALSHHRNGFQTYRAVLSLLALTGSFDRRGGQVPMKHTYNHVPAGFTTREHDFTEATFPEKARPAVGAERFPLWYELKREMQAMDLGRQIAEGTPYPIKALFACGLNVRMFPDTQAFCRALEKLDFVVNCDLFMTDACRYADVVLPVCSSFERGEFKVYGGGYAMFTKPVIAPLYESKSDAQILCELASRMGLGDPLLEAGYEKGVEFITDGLPFTLDGLKASEYPVKLEGLTPYVPGTALQNGLPTPSGKFELLSGLIAAHPDWGLDALPTFTPPIPDEECNAYPFTLCSGGSIPNALHSRLHDVPWLRSMRPEPLADIHPDDAERLGVADGDEGELYNDTGRITLRARLTHTVPQGVVFTYHGYREANPEELVSADALDPYTGFPAYRSVRCGVRKKG